jgi:Tol biopolymer transport system component
MDNSLRWTGFALAAAFVGSIARAQSTERVSIDSSGVEGNSDSGGGFYAVGAVLSADGRYVLFSSNAWNLVPNDGNGYWDTFLRDRLSGQTQRIDLTYNGLECDGTGFGISLSADGRFACFASGATNLVPNDANSTDDVFLRDIQNGTTERVSLGPNSVEGNSGSGYPSVSADGRYVAFVSAATNFVASDTNGRIDVFVRDRVLGTTERVSVASNGTQADFNCSFPAISADGRFVAFESVSTTLVPGDTNLVWDIFVRDRLLATTERVSVDSAGVEANDRSRYPAISGDGRFVTFYSFATNLVPGDTNGHEDVFVRDRLLGTTERVSVDSSGVEGDSISLYPDISADGRFVAFESLSTNLVPGDTNGLPDIFVRDRLLGTTERISVDSSGVQANDQNWFPRISADGRFVTYSSRASNLVPGDTNGWEDVFLRDRGAFATSSFCLGDGSAGDCPCANNGLPWHGCDNSAASGGAQLACSGDSSLASDTLVLQSSSELDHALSVFLQGSLLTAPLNFGDGLRCTSGILKRLYIRNASGGVVSVPEAGDPSISARSAALGDVLGAGTLRFYQTYYRDPVMSFCPNPPGNSWNISSGILVVWDP